MSLRLLGSVVIAGGLLVTAPAFATAPAGSATPASPSALVVHVLPIFGADAATGFGWSEIVARLDNSGAVPIKGTVDVVSSLSWSHDQDFTTRAPFNVPAGRSAIVRLPTHGYPMQASSLTVTAKNENGSVLSNATVNTNGSLAPLLVDVDEPSRLSVVLRGATVATSWTPTTGYGGTGTTSSLTVGAPQFDRATGDPILPEHAAGYAPVTVVLIHADALARLEAGSLDALVNWVLSGGTLAVVPTRPEDLRGPVLTALLGGTVTEGAAPSVLLSAPTYAPIGANGSFTAPTEEETPPKAGTVPGATRVGPGLIITPKLTGYTGGNLHASAFGASALYGTGEVHLLPFDPTVTPMIDDPWVRGRMLALVEHSWDRRSMNAFPEGSTPRNPSQMNEVRRSLDPNENFRPALGIAAILLVIYSIVAGPLTFLRAVKKGNPLSPLKWAPLWSAITFGLVVLIGLAGKGWRGRARHLSVAEVGAGVSRGSVRRFRGFFTSETRTISIASTDKSCVLDVISGDSSSKDHNTLRLDRNGATLEELTALPWQTVVVLEDGFTDLKGGVGVLMTPDGSADVVNHTGRALKDVIVYVPGQNTTYFAGLANNTIVHASTGRVVAYTAGRRSLPAGSLSVHPLDASSLGSTLGGPEGTKLSETWQAIENAAGNSVDWWPDGVPVVLAEVAGGEAHQSDADLSIESDRMFLRVIGIGGTL